MPELPDVVGAAEAAEALGVPVPSITRWRKAGRMPSPVAELASTWVWLREDVAEMRRRRDAGEPAAWPVRDKLPIVGTSEAAGLLGKNKSQIGRWRRAGVFPAPACELAAGPLWWRDDVVRFGAARVAA